MPLSALLESLFKKLPRRKIAKSQILLYFIAIQKIHWGQSLWVPFPIHNTELNN